MSLHNTAQLLSAATPQYYSVTVNHEPMAPSRNSRKTVIAALSVAACLGMVVYTAVSPASVSAFAQTATSSVRPSTQMQVSSVHYPTALRLR